MVKKRLRGFYRILRIIVCFCLIIVIVPKTYSEAYEISLAEKDAAYRKNTDTADFGDFKIESNRTGSGVAVIAIHGGKIETGTTELAYALASRNNYSYYSFLGVKLTENYLLHIESDLFDEQIALETVSGSETTISIHGCAGSKEFTYVGGRDVEMADKVKDSLIKYGFTVREAPDELAGLSPDNIANKNQKGAGVQLELSQGLREQLLISGVLQNYVLAVSEAVNETTN
ncbi:MAG TPA: poly-gamma-glutamate hydrolase family protein [Anaerovoracaceae bacterium]|nr:poly-gamma-glutamate hydrolase family protein [Anaerovoracaceae bacterium]